MKQIIEQEIKWCEEHRGMKPKEFEEGFIEGLKQAIFLLNAAKQYVGPATNLDEKFLKKYVLGEGYPWAMGTNEYKEVALSEQAFGFQPIVISFPKELWDKGLPRYRLVLERIDETVQRTDEYGVA